MHNIGLRIIIAGALFSVSSRSAIQALAAVPIYDGLITGIAAQITHGAHAVTTLVLTPIVLFKGVK